MTTNNNQNEPVNETAIFIQPDVVDVMRDSSTEIVKAGEFGHITTVDEYRTLVEYVKNGREAVKSIDKLLEEPTRKAFEAHRAMTRLRHELLDPVIAKIDAADREATRWYDEQERIRKQREAEAIAEQQRIQKQAEEERQRKIQEKRQEEIKQAEAEQLKAAERAEKLGMPDVRDEILSQPIVIDESQIYVPPVAPPPPVVIEKEVPVIPGRSYRKGKWEFSITDPSLIPREFLEAGLLNMKPTDPRFKAIQNHAELFEAAAKIPGVKFTQGGLIPVTKGK